ALPRFAFMVPPKINTTRFLAPPQKAALGLASRDPLALGCPARRGAEKENNNERGNQNSGDKGQWKADGIVGGSLGSGRNEAGIHSRSLFSLPQLLARKSTARIAAVPRARNSTRAARHVSTLEGARPSRKKGRASADPLHADHLQAHQSRG